MLQHSFQRFDVALPATLFKQFFQDHNVPACESLDAVEQADACVVTPLLSLEQVVAEHTADVFSVDIWVPDGFLQGKDNLVFHLVIAIDIFGAPECHD